VVGSRAVGSTNKSTNKRESAAWRVRVGRPNSLNHRLRKSGFLVWSTRGGTRPSGGGGGEIGAAWEVWEGLDTIDYIYATDAKDGPQEWAAAAREHEGGIRVKAERVGRMYADKCSGVRTVGASSPLCPPS
jgi:hypothetical protein